jgi:hypothetical protein
MHRFDANPDLDRHQHGNSDPDLDRHQHDADPIQHRIISAWQLEWLKLLVTLLVFLCTKIPVSNNGFRETKKFQNPYRILLLSPLRNPIRDGSKKYKIS